MLGALLLAIEQRCFGAGLAAGATAGLKLAGAFYCPALALAVLALPGSARERARRLALLAAGGLLGMALTYGWWGWQLWLAHGNRFFPFFNDLFHAPGIAAQSWLDLRFRPQGPLDVLLAPLQLLLRSQRFSEAGLKDPRLLLALLGFAWLAWSTRSTHLRLLCTFVVAGTLAWALQSGIYRYAIALELLGALALALVLARVPIRPGLAMVLAFVLVSADTRRPDWHRVTDSVRPLVARAQVPPDAIVVTASGEPLGYLALALPDEVPMLGLNNNFIRRDDCNALPREAASRVAEHRGAIFLATRGDPADQAFLRETYGLEPAGPCQALESRVGDALLCPQRRASGKIHRWNFHTGTSCAS
jgi:hypothetical protein